MIFVPCAHVVLVCNSCQQPCPAHIGRTLPALFFLYGVNTPNHSENDRGSRFAVNIRHCLRSFSLFYFVSRPIDFEKYILYRKGGTQNERTGKTQGNRAAHYTPAQGKTHPAQFAVSAVQCAHPAQAPLSPAREEGLRMPEHIRQEPKVLVSTENLTEQEWLAYRRQGIGGSDVAAILGISPFRTARDLYDDKLNIASAVDDTGNWVALEMGHLLEPLVAQIFTKKTGLEVFQIKKMFQHPQYPFMLADVDYFVRLPNGEIALLEIKTTNYNAKDHWWKDGEECVPVYYETQGRHYMAVMDMDEIFYCCLYGNNEDEAIIRHLYRDREYEQEMVYASFARKAALSSEALQIVCPKRANDLVDEGKALHHCVGNYIDKVAEGRCLIVFVRRVEEPKKPYVTVEVRDGKIAQIHGDHNSDPTEEVKKFVDLWSRKVLPMAL
jgi:putative phage-type endonuclease